jgi:predicted AlkP superfamily pyrophosphatase or phosphodiesterase
MKKSLLVCWLMACLPMVPVKAETPKLIVAILVDQLRYDYLERFDDQFTTNGFRMFTDRGVFMTSARYDYFPTVTAPGHASAFSGSPPCVHGIIGNEWFDKRTRRIVYCVEDSSVRGVGTTTTKGDVSPRNFVGATFADQLRLRYRSKVIGISMKDRGAILPAGKKPAGAFWFELKSGHFATSTYYMQKLPEWVNQFNVRKRVAEFAGATWDRLLDPEFYSYSDLGAGEGTLSGETNSTFPHTVILSKETGYEHLMPTPYGNELLAEFARAAIEGEELGLGPQPDLLCVSFSSIDSCGHRFGPYSQEVQDITLRLDRQLNEFFNYLDQKVGLDHVAMVLTSDHGVAPTPEFAIEQGMDGQRLNESEWMVELMGKLDERFGSGKYFLSPKAYGGNLHFDPETLEEKKLSSSEVAAFIRDWALSTGKFQACYSREQLLEGHAPGLVGQLVLNGYHAQRSGDVVLIPKPFVIPSSSKTGTTHGSPYSYDTHVPVLFYGLAFKKGRYADEFYISDIVPTLCASLRMDVPPGCTGKPFVKALIPN